MRNHPLRILYIGYSLLPISEASCGGAEQVLLLVQSQMHLRGHETVVAACAGSEVAGELFATGDPPGKNDGFEARDAEHIARVLEFVRSDQQVRPFDLIHDHGGSFWKHAALLDVPVLATLHLPRPFYPGTNFNAVLQNVTINCVSQSQARQFSHVPQFAGVVRNGIDIERFPFSDSKQGYLLWLGRICHEKGAHVALDVARECRIPIVLAGQLYPFSYHHKYLQEEIAPRLNRMQGTATLLGGLSLQQKLELLRGARAVLIPSLVDETSSLVAMEAMACGTPVVCLRRGALPEVVADGSTGFVVDSPEEMAAAVAMVHRVDPHTCRQRVEHHFAATRMAAEYDELYARLISAGKPLGLASYQEPSRGGSCAAQQSARGGDGFQPRPSVLLHR